MQVQVHDAVPLHFGLHIICETQKQASEMINMATMCGKTESACQHARQASIWRAGLLCIMHSQTMAASILLT